MKVFHVAMLGRRESSQKRPYLFLTVFYYIAVSKIEKMAKYYLIEANEVPTTMMERIQNEGQKPVKFIVERHGFLSKLFGPTIEERIEMVAFNWNPKSLKKGRQIVFP